MIGPTACNLMQGFTWESHARRDSHKQPGWLQQLAGHAAEIAECGVTAVWLPPPCHSIAEQGYMPQVGRRMSQRCSLHELRELCMSFSLCLHKVHAIPSAWVAGCSVAFT